MKLYHGTTERVARLALVEGLKPRAYTGHEGHWKHTVDSNPLHVYLSTCWAPYFANSASEEGERWAIIEVDTDLLDEERMRPDEDFLEQATRGNPNAPGPKKGGMKARTRWYRKNLAGFAHHWRDSVEGLGTCSHAGILPASAITRVSLFAPRSNKVIWMDSCDPTITIINYKVNGGKYMAITRWILGEEVAVDDYLGWAALALPADEKAKAAKILGNRSGIELLKAP